MAYIGAIPATLLQGMGDSDILKIGDGPDLTLYHDGSNSYITNLTGALKIATETSGIAITIGHGTSEVTVADNLTVTGTLTLGSGAELTEAELEFLDGITAGTAAASKAMVLDSSADITGGRNLTISGELDAATGDFSGDVDVDGTLEADAITINSTAIGSIYGVVAGSSSIVTTGALDSGSITSGFGAIDNGTSNIRSATITAETAFVPDASGGADLGTTALEFNDLFLNDDGSIQFGDDQDTTLVHTDGTGLTLNSTNKLCFNDASQFVQGSSATVLSIGATDEIDLTATAIDINGTCDVSGTLTNSSAAVKVAGKETMWIPATAMYAETTNGAELAQTVLTGGGPELKAFAFDTSTAEAIQFNVSFPESWNAGTVTFQTFWSASATDTGTGGFTLAGCSVASNVDYDLAFGTPVANTALAASGTQDDLMVNVESGAVTIASVAASTNTIFRLVRDTGTDTNTGDLRLVGIKLFYTTNAANDA